MNDAGGGAQVLRNLPFLKTLPAPVFDALLARGNLVKCERGEVGALLACINNSRASFVYLMSRKSSVVCMCMSTLPCCKTVLQIFDHLSLCASPRHVWLTVLLYQHSNYKSGNRPIV